MPIKFIRTEEPNILKDGWRVEMEVPNGAGIDAIVDTFRMFLLGISYQPETVKENVPNHSDVFGNPRTPLEVGDRVRYYGAFNSSSEIVTGTVLEIEDGLVNVSLDSFRDNDDTMKDGPCDQWAHPKQLRKLKKRR